MLIYEDYSYAIPFWGVSRTALETLNTTRHINQTIPFRSIPFLATRGELAARSIFAALWLFRPPFTLAQADSHIGTLSLYLG